MLLIKYLLSQRTRLQTIKKAPHFFWGNKGGSGEEWQHIPWKTDHQKYPPFWRTPRTERTCHCQCDHRSQPAKKGGCHLLHTPYSLLTPAVLLGKLHWIVLLVSRKVLPNGRWHTRENTKQHSKYTPLFCPSSQGLVQWAFQHFGLDANDTLC